MPGGLTWYEAIAALVILVLALILLIAWALRRGEPLQNIDEDFTQAETPSPSGRG